MSHPGERHNWTAGGWKHRQPTKGTLRVRVDVDPDAVDGVDARLLAVGDRLSTVGHSVINVHVVESLPRAWT